MSCYFRHMKDIFNELELEVTKDNKKAIDNIIHEIVNIEYKDCPNAWKEIKKMIKNNDADKKEFIRKLKNRLQSI